MNVLSIIPSSSNAKRVRIWISINLYIILLIISIYFSITYSSTRLSICQSQPQQKIRFLRLSRYSYPPKKINEAKTKILVNNDLFSEIEPPNIHTMYDNRAARIFLRSSLRHIVISSTISSENLNACFSWNSRISYVQCIKGVTENVDNIGRACDILFIKTVLTFTSEGDFLAFNEFLRYYTGYL